MTTDKNHRSGICVGYRTVVDDNRDFSCVIPVDDGVGGRALRPPAVISPAVIVDDIITTPEPHRIAGAQDRLRLLQTVHRPPRRGLGAGIAVVTRGRHVVIPACAGGRRRASGRRRRHRRPSPTRPTPNRHARHPAARGSTARRPCDDRRRGFRVWRCTEFIRTDVVRRAKRPWPAFMITRHLRQRRPRIDRGRARPEMEVRYPRKGKRRPRAHKIRIDRDIAGTRVFGLHARRNAMVAQR